MWGVVEHAPPPLYEWTDVSDHQKKTHSERSGAVAGSAVAKKDRGGGAGGGGAASGRKSSCRSNRRERRKRRSGEEGARKTFSTETKMSLSNAQAVAILLMNKRKRRVLRKQLTPGPMFFEDRGDLNAHTEAEDWGTLSAATERVDLNWATS
jgi:hypothetical protein